MENAFINSPLSVFCVKRNKKYFFESNQKILCVVIEANKVHNTTKFYYILLYNLEDIEHQLIYKTPCVSVRSLGYISDKTLESSKYPEKLNEAPCIS